MLAALSTPALAAKPAKVEVGKVRLATPTPGRAALLVPVHYPVHMLGRRGELRLVLRGAGLRTKRWTVRPVLSGGRQRKPERRRRFTFVHRIDLPPALAQRLRKADHVRLQVRARAVMDIEGDGRAELRSVDSERQRLGKAAGRRQCADLPRLRPRPGARVAVGLPLCGGPVGWRIAKRPEHGRARIRHGKLIYNAPRRARGSERIVLRARGRASGSTASASAAATETPVEVTVAAREGISVRAIGDSVTAAFGYFDDGSEMSITELLDCKPGLPYDDACSSNSTVRSNEAPAIEYSPDYGLANNVSWAAQWANQHGVTDYRNYAVSGSEPVDWRPGGALRAETEAVIADDPDYIVMTLGANPILSNTLFGLESIACGLFSSEREWPGCVDKAFAEVELGQNLRGFYEELIEATSSTILVMQYHLSVPAAALYSAWQIAVMGKMMNEEIENAVEFADPSGKRLKTFKPPHFNVGVSVEPAYPSTYGCGTFFDYEVDGPSVQASVAQAELHIDHPLSFCGGPKEGPPWVIGGDTGIHPSAAGYTQMMSVLPPPG